MKSIAIVSEDLAQPLDEGFKKASAALALSMASLGIEVSVFARKAHGLPLPARALPHNKLLLGSGFARELKQADPEVILYIPEAAATPMSLVRARLIKRQSGGKPVAVLSLQRREYGSATPLVRLLAPDFLLVLSEHSLATALAAGLRAEIVPLGVDVSAFRPARPDERKALRAKYGVGDAKVILHVGHISRSRNLGLLKQILAPGRQMVIVSSTSTRRSPEVRRAFEGSNVVFIDKFVDAIDEIYRLADCYVFPTFSAAGAIEIPLSVLEAMATNLPVVTTAFGGLPWLFKDVQDLERQGLFFARSELEFLEKLEPALARADVTTRRLVEAYSWQRAAKWIVETIDRNLRAQPTA